MDGWILEDTDELTVRTVEVTRTNVVAEKLE
jgi:hypothetical protein